MDLNQYVITIDIDWAPDWIIEKTAKILLEHQVKATWFVTHKSSAIDELLKNDSFEVGLHPNFLSGSSHGDTYEEVMNTLLGWYPGVKTVRSHSLFQSEKILQMMCEDFQIEIDCSIYLKGCEGIRPHKVRYSERSPFLTRVPHFFQDNMDMINKTPWDLKDSYYQKAGLKVFSFHPIHLILNSKNISAYEILKNDYDITLFTPELVAPFVNHDKGVFTLFLELIDELSNTKSFTIDEIVNIWGKSNNH